MARALSSETFSGFSFARFFCSPTSGIFTSCISLNNVIISTGSAATAGSTIPAAFGVAIIFCTPTIPGTVTLTDGSVGSTTPRLDATGDIFISIGVSDDPDDPDDPDDADNAGDAGATGDSGGDPDDPEDDMLAFMTPDDVAYWNGNYNFYIEAGYDKDFKTIIVNNKETDGLDSKSMNHFKKLFDEIGSYNAKN